MPVPTNITELRSFTGMCNVLRWMIPNYAELLALLDELKRTGKHVTRDWSEQQQNAFLAIKKMVVEGIKVYIVDWNKQVDFTSDASGIGVAAYVWQKDDNGNVRII